MRVTRVKRKVARGLGMVSSISARGRHSLPFFMKAPLRVQASTQEGIGVPKPTVPELQRGLMDAFHIQLGEGLVLPPTMRGARPPSASGTAPARMGLRASRPPRLRLWIFGQTHDLELHGCCQLAQRRALPSWHASSLLKMSPPPCGLGGQIYAIPVPELFIGEFPGPS